MFAPDTGRYESQKADVDYRYTNESATNAYSRFLSQQRGERGMGDMTRNFQRSYPNYKSQFGARGLGGGGIRSGVMNQAMNRYAGDHARNFGRAQQDLTQDLQQHDLTQQNLTAWRNNSIAAIEQSKAAEIANAAEALQMMQQIIGGLG